MKQFLSLGLIFFAGLFPAFAQDSAAKKEKKVLIIGIDGLRPDALAKAETPHIDKLIQHGSFADNTRILGERYRKNNTISGPGWSSILSGVWADKHGVHDNRFLGANYKNFPHFFQRVKAARPEAFTVSMVSWKPIDQFIVSDADLRLVEPTAGANDRSLPPEARLANEDETDRNLAATAAWVLKGKNPTAMFIYFHQVDATGHTLGFSSNRPEYLRAIQNVDGYIGSVLKALRSRASYDREDWLIIVCADHGGREKNHSAGHDVPEINTVCLIVSGPCAVKGQIKEQTYLVDVTPTALAHLGIPTEAAWELDGRPVGVKVE